MREPLERQTVIDLDSGVVRTRSKFSRAGAIHRECSDAKSGSFVRRFDCKYGTARVWSNTTNWSPGQDLLLYFEFFPSSLSIGLPFEA